MAKLPDNPRGFISDSNSGIFRPTIFGTRDTYSGQSEATAKSLLYRTEPLDPTEYRNRKLPHFAVPDPESFMSLEIADLKDLRLPYPHCMFLLGDERWVQARDHHPKGIELQFTFHGVAVKTSMVDTGAYLHKLSDEDWKVLTKATSIADEDTTGAFMSGSNIQRLHTRRLAEHKLRQELNYLVMLFRHILNGLDTGQVVIDDPLGKGLGKPSTASVPSEANPDDVVKVLSLRLPTQTTRKPHNGGTHASPREHTRRGHWRHYKSGKRVWIKQRTINKGVGGRVEKIYKLTTQEDSQ